MVEEDGVEEKKRMQCDDVGWFKYPLEKCVAWSTLKKNPAGARLCSRQPFQQYSLTEVHCVGIQMRKVKGTVLMLHH